MRVMPLGAIERPQSFSITELHNYVTSHGLTEMLLKLLVVLWIFLWIILTVVFFTLGFFPLIGVFSVIIQANIEAATNPITEIVFSLIEGAVWSSIIISIVGIVVKVAKSLVD